jgi:hypothetical protein
MGLDTLTSQLDRNAHILHSLVQGITEEQARWKPSPDAWSSLEVVCHLGDEEREDFRAHLDLILHHANQPWPSIDPRGWVTQRGYNQRELAKSVEEFLDARKASLEWLNGLEDPDWEATYTMPWGGLKAGDMAASWVAHDLMHTRQLVELRLANTQRLAAPYSTKYAGAW